MWTRCWTEWTWIACSRVLALTTCSRVLTLTAYLHGLTWTNCSPRPTWAPSSPDLPAEWRAMRWMCSGARRLGWMSSSPGGWAPPPPQLHRSATPGTRRGPGRSYERPSWRTRRSWRPGRHPREPAGALRGFRVAVRRLRRRRGHQYRRVHADPGRRFLRGERGDRQVDQLDPERRLGWHCLPRLVVHLLCLFLGGERQDVRHGAVRDKGRAVRWHPCRCAASGAAHAGTAVELPGLRPGIPRNPPGPTAAGAP